MKLLHNLMAVCAILVTSFFMPSTASADEVIEDQIGSSYQHLFPHLGTRAFWESVDSYSLPATRRISPTGGFLNTVSFTGIGVDLGATRNMTTQEWNTMDFKILFYSSTSMFLDNPENYTWSWDFAAPSNNDWLTPIGQFQGFDRHRFTFDLGFKNEWLSPGQDFAIAFAGLSSDPVRIRTCFSDGLGMGSEIDLAGFDTGSTRVQDYLNNLSAPSDWHGTEITVVPEPATLAVFGIGAAYLLRRKSRSRR